MAAVTVPGGERAARLRRMRGMAGGLLALLAAVYLASTLAERRWPAFGWLRAFSEAATVGGAADWFAVTALFRRPLGLPIPHTAIVPRGKDRIGGALGRFIVENFLAPRMLDAKLREAAVVDRAGRWLGEPAHAREIARRLLAAAPAAIEGLPDGVLGELFGSVALQALEAVPAAPAGAALLSRIWSEGRAQALVDRGAELLGTYLSEHQEVILQAVQTQSWKWLPSWVDKAIAGRITEGLVKLLADVRQPEHPWRARLGDVVEDWIARLASDPGLRERGEALKAQLLADPRLAERASALGSDLRRRLVEGGLASPALEDRVTALLEAFAARLQGDAALRRSLETALRAAVRRHLAPRRQAIGRFVAQVVAGWDADNIVERLERLVGPDLQYIRINGAVVGGLVGLLLYALARLARLA